MKKNDGWNFGEVLECGDQVLLTRKAQIQAAETRVIPAVSVIRARSAQSALRILGLHSDQQSAG